MQPKNYRLHKKGNFCEEAEFCGAYVDASISSNQNSLDFSRMIETVIKMGFAAGSLVNGCRVKTELLHCSHRHVNYDEHCLCFSFGYITRFIPSCRTIDTKDKNVLSTGKSRQPLRIFCCIYQGVINYNSLH